MAVPSPVLEPVPRRRLARRWALAAAAAMALVAGGAAAAVWWGGSSPPDGTGLASGTPRLYVLQAGGLEVVDPVGGAVAGRLSWKGGHPHGSAPAPDGRFLFLLDGRAVLVYAAEGHRQVTAIDLPAWPRRIAVSPDGALVAVSLAEDPDVRLFRWDGVALHPDRRLSTAGEPGALLFDETGRILYTGMEDGVLALDVQTGAIRFRAPLPKPHQLDPVRKLLQGPNGILYAYYINWDHLGAIAVISPGGGQVHLREFHRVIHDIALAPDGQTLYATWRTAVPVMPRRGGLLALDPTSLDTMRPEVDLGWAMGLAVSPDGRSLYVTESRRPFRWEIHLPGALVRIDSASLQVRGRRPVGRLPQYVMENY